MTIPAPMEHPRARAALVAFAARAGVPLADAELYLRCAFDLPALVRARIEAARAVADCPALYPYARIYRLDAHEVSAASRGHNSRRRRQK